MVTTSASIYVIDLDHRTARRIPGAGACPEEQIFNVKSLEADNEFVALDELTVCVLGFSMMLFTDPRPDGSICFRMSTPVVEIRRLPDQPHPQHPEQPEKAGGAA